MSRTVWTRLAVVLPVIGVALLALRAEVDRLGETVWELPIAGYDPRDLVHGHYLLYRYDLSPSIGAGCAGLELSIDECCVCLSPGNAGMASIEYVACDVAPACDGWLRTEYLEGGQRYLVPEASAKDLETALRDRDASVELVCAADGRPAVGELRIDGRPWREAIGRPVDTP